MEPTRERWWLLALLLFLMLGVVACDEKPAADEPLSTKTTPPPAAIEVGPTAIIAPSATPLIETTYKGVAFMFDEQLLGSLGQSEHLPPVPPGRVPAQPERLKIALSKAAGEESPQLYVFPVAQYKALSAKAAEEIAHLRELLAERPDEYPADLPFLPMYEAVQSYHSDPIYLDFQNGSGMSYLTRADHDHSLATEEAFFYTFQGLTDDGRFYVAALAPLTDSVNGEVEPVQGGDLRAKPANNGGWFGVSGDSGHSIIDNIMLSLQVTPDESFPRIILPDYVLSEGLIAAYDGQNSGIASVSRIPAIVENPQGSSEFLEGLPDILYVQFDQKDTEQAQRWLQIQSLKNEDGEYYEAIPEWQREEASAIIGGQVPEFMASNLEDVADGIQEIDFQNGAGLRWISRVGDETRSAGDDSEQSPIYQFKGVSDDGRFLVHLRHPLTGSQSPSDSIDSTEPVDLVESIEYLDRLVNSIFVGPEVSMATSVPLNDPDCINDAKFVADVSIPDDTVVERGDLFIKIWRVRNSGTCSWTPANHVLFYEGNPLEWQELSITSVVAPGEETEVGISVQSPILPGIYQAWWRMADEREQLFGDSLKLRFEAPRAATDIPGYGVIEGNISYPANGNPAVDIYFLRTDGSERYAMQTEPGWTSYSNSVPAGDYYVFARVTGDSSDSGGGYTQAVICGLHANCQDHDLLIVEVIEGRAARNVNIFDWYAPTGSFPLPEAIVPQEPATEEAPEPAQDP